MFRIIDTRLLRYRLLPMNTFTLRSSIARMLQRDVASALSCDNKTIQKQPMKPISNFITQTSVHRLWDSVQPPDVLHMLWHLPQEVSVTVTHPIMALWWIFGMIYSLGHPQPSALVSLPESPANPW